MVLSREWLSTGSFRAGHEKGSPTFVFLVDASSIGLHNTPQCAVLLLRVPVQNCRLSVKDTKYLPQTNYSQETRLCWREHRTAGTRDFHSPGSLRGTTFPEDDNHLQMSDA